MKPNTRNGRQAKKRRQEAAEERRTRPKTPEEKLLHKVFGKKRAGI